MTDRIVDISDEAVGLSMRKEQLVIRREADEVSIPLVDMAVLIVSHPFVHFTHSVLSGLCKAGGVFIVCNEKRLPAGMMLPFEGHFVQTERFRAQAQASLPMQKGVWKQIVKAKVRAQGNALLATVGEDYGLLELAKKVCSGDSGNIEAHASRIYWTSLFGKEFRRDFEAEDQNRLLNYGYAVLRGITARAICAAGLHPSLGVHHHNRYNSFCLADDLMEPFRPVVDRAVFDIINERGREVPLDRATKTGLIKVLSGGRFNLDGESRTIFDVMARTASSLAGVFAGTRKGIVLPEI